jgi:DNA-binding MarR family transcriptional regulator
MCLNTYTDPVVTNLQAELKQSRPFKNLAEEAYLSLQRTAAVLEHQLEAALKPSGVTATQYNVLRILRGAGDQGLCRHEIGERLIRTVSDVTRLLDRLEDSHLITRARGGEDRRYVTTRITAAGLRLLTHLDSQIDAIHRTQFEHMDAERLRALVDLLALVRNVH